MVRTNEEYLNNSLTYVYQSEISERVYYTANTAIVSSSAANSNLDGTGGTNTKYLLTEVSADTETKFAIYEAFERTILFDDNFDLQAAYYLLASAHFGKLSML